VDTLNDGDGLDVSFVSVLPLRQDGNTMKSVTVKVSKALANRLALVARERGGNRSEIVREALEAHLDHPRANSGSCLDLARDLAGTIDSAPPDLSTNRRHLRHYGR
jgi:Arc/MetJ-type ribon-helix-helix transcriptional regulator